MVIEDNRVLITGANGGIGAALAKEFARNDHNLILAVRSKESVKDVVKACKNYNVTVSVVEADLADPGGAKKIFMFCKRKRMRVEYLVNNAGFSNYGKFAKIPKENNDELLAVNIIALTDLTALFLPQLTKARGGILNIASTAAFLPGPLMATYYASKSYVLNFSLALREELKGKVGVSVLCPGPTKSGFQNRAKMSKSKLMNGDFMSAEKVAKVAYKGFIVDKAIITPGFKNKLVTLLPRLLPKTATARIIRKIQSEA